MINQNQKSRVGPIIAVVAGIIILAIVVSQCSMGSSTNNGDIFNSSNSRSYWDTQETVEGSTVVPWDYRVVEGTVGDLIGGDMTILPDNQLMANDDQYATGDKIWTLQHMSANMNENSQKKARITLSTWMPIKSYRNKETAETDLNRLKVSLKTKVDLVGVYETKLNGKTRQFAVLELPSGQQIKQPIDAKRYASLKPAKQAEIIMEEIHDYSNFDLAYSKFRGWAS